MKLELGRLREGQSLMSRLSFRAKLLLVLFVPFLALVVVAAAGLSDRFTALHAQEQYGDLSGPLHSLDRASRALQNESVVSSWYVASRRARRPPSSTGRPHAAPTPRSRRSVTNEQAFATAGLSPAALAALDAANRGFDEIRPRRGRIDASSRRPRRRTRDFFLGVDGHLLDFGERWRATSPAPTSPPASPGSSRSSARSTSTPVRRACTSRCSPAARPRTSASGSARRPRPEQYLAQFRNTATPEELAAYTEVIGAPRARPRHCRRRSRPPRRPRPSTTSTTSVRVGQLDRADRHGRARDQRDRQRQRQRRAARGAHLRRAAVFAMFLTLLLIWFVSRAVVGPLRRLTAAAREMSQRQLPRWSSRCAPVATSATSSRRVIEVQSEDEIGELAQAFNDVEAVTLQVAQEQSRLLRKGMGDLFVNLARRNQSLVQRQLELLDDLERNEHDPAALDSLFKLDHMATRMRRNAESLLVLSGAEQPRQWQQPIALIDVVRGRGRRDRRLPPRRARRHRRRPRGVGPRGVRRRPPPRRAARERDVVLAARHRRGGVRRGVGDRLRARGVRPGHRHAARAHRRGQHSCSPTRPSSASRSRGRSACTWSVRSPQRHGISVELRPGAPGRLVALVALPTAVLEPRPVAAPPAPPPRTPCTRPTSTTAARPSRSVPVAWCRVRPTSRRWRSGAGRASPRRAAPSAPVEPAPRPRTRRPDVDAGPTRPPTTAPRAAASPARYAPT